MARAASARHASSKPDVTQAGWLFIKLDFMLAVAVIVGLGAAHSRSDVTLVVTPALTPEGVRCGVHDGPRGRGMAPKGIQSGEARWG